MRTATISKITTGHLVWQIAPQPVVIVPVQYSSFICKEILFLAMQNRKNTHNMKSETIFPPRTTSSWLLGDLKIRMKKKNSLDCEKNG